ncbi:MAG: hypothetical protein P4L69_05210 [Desulfosporosinus sp.]|nr:hypothetical protein [Desulfosporosinus sp.]
MEFKVATTKTRPIRLVNPRNYQLSPTENQGPITITKYDLEGATFSASPMEASSPVPEGTRKTVTFIPYGKVDVLHLNDLTLVVEMDPSIIHKVELRIGGALIAKGVFDSRGILNFFATKVDIPMVALYTHSVEIRTFHSGSSEPTFAIPACTVKDPKDREILKRAGFNILFAYADRPDMNVLTIEDGMATLRHSRVGSSIEGGVTCLQSSPVPPPSFATTADLELWLEKYYIVTPPLPYILKDVF